MFNKILAMFAISIGLMACQKTLNDVSRPLTTDQSSPSKVKPLPLTLLSLTPYFYVGTAVNQRQIHNTPNGVHQFLPSQFNALTAENAMKWGTLAPEKGEYLWQDADKLVAYAQKHKMHVTGHVFVWHQQTPGWIFEDDAGNLIARDELIKRLRTHIFTVAKRYQGKIHTWDVVNEALNDDGTLRNSKWLQLIGKDYIALAFKFAQQAVPDAELIYNDYNLFMPEKRAGALRLIKNIQSQGIAVHGIGMQAHYSLDHPNNLQQVEDSIIAFADAGLNVHLTELDISVLPFPSPDNQGADISLNMKLKEQFNLFTNGLNKEASLAFNKRYKNLFSILLKNHKKIKRVTFWGVNDGDSWRNHWPMSGRTDYPLLINRSNQLKPVAFDILKRAPKI